MQWLTPAARPVAAPAPDDLVLANPAAAATLFGGHTTASLASNFQLKGVVMASDPGESVAILSVNGKPAHAVKAHREVSPGVTVREVQRHHVLLDDGGVIKRVELPKNEKRK